MCQMVARRLGFFLVALFGVVASSSAVSPQTAAHVGGRFGPSPKAEKHPKKIVFTQVVEKGFGGAAGSYRFCVSYFRTASARPDKGSLTAVVELVRDDDTRKVGAVSKTSARNGRIESCTSAGVALEAGDVLVWTLKFKGMPKVPSGDFVDFGAEVVAPGGPSAAFRLAGAGYDERVQYVDGPNLIFCRTDAGFADLWIRLAQDTTADGEDGPHIDIDVCNYEGGGRFKPLDPANPSCGSAKTWDVFWHDGEGGVFLSQAGLARCELTLSDEPGSLEGAFACTGMVEMPEGRTLDLSGGLFRCNPE